MVNEFAKCSEHVFSHGRLPARMAIPRTEYCTPEEWNRRVEVSEKDRGRIVAETRDAWEVLGRCIAEPRAISLVDMAEMVS